LAAAGPGIDARNRGGLSIIGSLTRRIDESVNRARDQEDGTSGDERDAAAGGRVGE
jgi:hypothetical protein